MAESIVIVTLVVISIAGFKLIDDLPVAFSCDGFTARLPEMNGGLYSSALSAKGRCRRAL